MIEGFDKEIDFLLRQTARRETVSGEQIPDSRFQIPNSNHLDPDEISALAENALPEKIRQSYVLHLADCGRCRKSLSVLIALNREAESENVFAEQTLTAEIVAPQIPWYRRFFAAPGLAYAMGALILVFAGVGIFTILQNDNSPNSQVSQISEKQTGGKGMSSDGDAATQEIYSNPMSSNTAAASNLAAANMMANTANSAMSTAPIKAANSNTVMMQREPEKVLKERLKDESAGKPNKSADSEMPTAAAPPPPTTNENNFELDGQNTQSPILSQNSGTQNQTQITPDSRNAPRAPMPAMKEQRQEDKSDDSKKSAVRRKSSESIVVGGKTFNRGNNVWADAAYRGQATTNITRGTKEYKKLDSGLRGIIENLGGTVVVVWKEKAYRIQ